MTTTATPLAGNPAGTTAPQGRWDGITPKVTPREGLTLTTYSQWNSFRACRQKCGYRYEEELVPLERAEALTTGDWTHQVLEEYHGALSWLSREYTEQHLFWIAGGKRMDGQYQMVPWFDELDAPTAARTHHILAMLRAYEKHWSQRPATWHKAIALELPFVSDIMNPATGARSRTFQLAGKVDGVVQRADGTYWLLEHKTTSKLDTAYLDRIWTDMQVQLYSIAIEREYGWPISGVIYNVLTKPNSRLTQQQGELEEEFETRKAGMARPGAAKRKLPESHDEYQERLAAWYADQYATNLVFHREELVFSKGDLMLLEIELWEMAQEYLRARREGTWFRNTSSCFNFNRACDYFHLCRSHGSDAIRHAYYTKRGKHEELADAMGATGADVDMAALEDALPF